MKEGLSGSIINEIEVGERWTQAQNEARALLATLKTRPQPSTARTNTFTSESRGYRSLAGRLMEKRMKERFKRNE